MYLGTINKSEMFTHMERCLSRNDKYEWKGQTEGATSTSKMLNPVVYWNWIEIDSRSTGMPFLTTPPELSPISFLSPFPAFFLSSLLPSFFILVVSLSFLYSSLASEFDVSRFQLGQVRLHLQVWRRQFSVGQPRVPPAENFPWKRIPLSTTPSASAGSGRKERGGPGMQERTNGQIGGSTDGGEFVPLIGWQGG